MFAETVVPSTASSASSARSLSPVSPARCDPLDEPFALGKDLGRLSPDDVRLLPPEDAAPGRVARLRQALLVEGDDAVRHALQHALVVVAHCLHVREELRVLESARDLRGEGA